MDKLLIKMEFGLYIGPLVTGCIYQGAGRLRPHPGFNSRLP